MAAWTTPKTWAAQDAVTGPLMNSNVRDNIKFLAENRYIEVLVAGASIGALTKTFNVTLATAKVAPILIVQVSCFVAGAGLTQIAVQWDGSSVGPIGQGNCTKYFNEISVHQQLLPFAYYLGTSGPSPTTAGAHTLSLVNAANATCDSNDFCSAWMIGL